MSPDRMLDALQWWSLGPWDAARRQNNPDQQGGSVVYRRGRSRRLLTGRDLLELSPYCWAEGGLTPRGVEKLAELRTAQRSPSASDSDGRSPEGPAATA